MFRKTLDRVGFEHQVGTYPYENDPSTPPTVPSQLKNMSEFCAFNHEHP